MMVAAVQEAVTAVEVVGRRRGRWWRLLAPAEGGGRRAERGETARWVGWRTEGGGWSAEGSTCAVCWKRPEGRTCPRRGSNV